MMETVLAFDEQGKTLCWHGRFSEVSFTDMLWESRGFLGGLAHTHQGKGPAIPSRRDLEAFTRIEKWLGRQFLWPVVTATYVNYIVRNPLYGYNGVGHRWTNAKCLSINIDGIDELRYRSGLLPRSTVKTAPTVDPEKATLEITLDGCQGFLPDPVPYDVRRPSADGDRLGLHPKIPWGCDSCSL